MTTSPRTLNSVIFNAFFIVCLICFVFCLTLQKYKKLRKSPNIWDILHHYVMNSIFPTFADAQPVRHMYLYTCSSGHWRYNFNSTSTNSLQAIYYRSVPYVAISVPYWAIRVPYFTISLIADKLSLDYFDFGRFISLDFLSILAKLFLWIISFSYLCGKIAARMLPLYAINVFHKLSERSRLFI